MQRTRSRSRSIGKYEGGSARLQKIKQIRAEQNTEANYQTIHGTGHVEHRNRAVKEPSQSFTVQWTMNAPTGALSLFFDESAYKRIYTESFKTLHCALTLWQVSI